jgi:hypothetical protein
VLITLLLLAGPVTAHALGSAAYRIGIPLSKPARENLALAVERTPPSGEKDVGCLTLNQ